MNFRFNHLNGQYDERTDSPLCEVFCTPENETCEWLFDNGWLPTINGEWYQSKSSRISLVFQNYNKPNFSHIKLSTVGDWEAIIKDTISHYSYLNIEHIQYCINTSKLVIYFDNKVFAVLNLYDGIPYVSAVIGTRKYKNILQYVIPVMKNLCFEIDQESPFTIKSDFLYIGEWYNKFSFKSSYVGFEWWDGLSWNGLKMNKN